MRFSLISIFSSVFIASTLGLPTRLPGGVEGICTDVPQGLACIVPCSDGPRGYCITISATGSTTAAATTTDVSSGDVAGTVTESSSTSTATAVNTAPPMPTDSGNAVNGTDESGRDGSIAIGTDANGEDGGIAIGANANGGDGGIAIGSDANVEDATGADGGVVFATSALPIPGGPVSTGKPGEAKPGKPGIVIGNSGEAKPGKPGIVHHYKY
ncbi:hypothetical protein EXIGLDRAFT_838267 [Exidia glandulosa HHB12029]|uniref:Uncharacterized protein n=1 Tax=Exidia glandulosa HHB12029 TaxID=1314781 RepID=A0A165G0Q5_EXIGL|nr:hypothetical protein EXIGLDRAFT_838267 [Exidia glandulosa HHB12029]